MSEQKHTPGPWEFAATDQFDQSLDIFESKTARTLFRTINSLPKEEALANASLSSAAPDLLLALEMICESCPLNQELNIVARAAIARAEGRGI